MPLQFCIQGVELAFKKSEKEFLKLTEVKQHERRSSVRELTFTRLHFFLHQVHHADAPPYSSPFSSAASLSEAKVAGLHAECLAAELRLVSDFQDQLEQTSR